VRRGQYPWRRAEAASQLLRVASKKWNCEALKSWSKKKAVPVTAFFYLSKETRLKYNRDKV
jgi:hypothetical protein